MRLAHGVLAVIESGSTQVGTSKNQNQNQEKEKAMGIFGGIGNVKATEQKGVYLPEGQHLVTVERCKLTESTVGNRTFFVVESTVMESNNDSISPGTRASWVVKLGGDYPQMALADIKKFAIAVTGADENEVATVQTTQEPLLQKRMRESSIKLEKAPSMKRGSRSFI